eukprot:9947349-Karenia_brevis.AAC.1
MKPNCSHDLQLEPKLSSRLQSAKNAKTPEQRSQGTYHLPRMPGLICQVPREMVRAAVACPVGVFDMR